MSYFSKRNHRTRLKRKTEFLNFMELARPWNKMYLKRTVHTICIALIRAIQQCSNTGCQKDSSNNQINTLILNSLVRVCEQGFTFKSCSSFLTSSLNSLPLSFESLLCSLTCLFSPTTLLTISPCFTAKLKPSFALVLLVFVHAASEVEVRACTRGILVFSRRFHS